MTNDLRRSAAGLALLAGAWQSAGAHAPLVDFDQLAHDSGAVYAATVVSMEAAPGPTGNMVFTRAQLADIDWIVEPQGGRPAKHSLYYPGGEWNGIGTSTCMTPQLEVGQRYVFFEDPAYHPEMPTATPFLGGAQGTFRLVRDAVTDTLYPVRGARAVLGVDGEDLAFTPAIEAIDGATARLAAKAPRTIVEPPISSATGQPIAPRAERPPGTMHPIDYAAFREAIVAQRGQARRSPSVLVEASGRALVPRQKLFDGNYNMLYERAAAVSAEPAPTAHRAGPTGLCGVQELPIHIERMAESSFTYEVDGYLLDHFNEYMNMYVSLPDDGSFGYNNQSEFGGFPSDADLMSSYGFSWGTALGLTAVFSNSSGGPCGPINETDVFGNPAASWATAPSAALSSDAVEIYPAMMVHELGHTWGNMDGIYVETYDYDVPTIMHAIYRPLNGGVYEQGFGLQPNDAFLLRGAYSDQQPVLAIRDVGVENYFADEGLNPATVSGTGFVAGGPITISGITVANNSPFAADDMRLRIFLSTDRIFSADDQLLGNGTYWTWESFPAEAWVAENFTSTVPTELRAGTYFIGVRLTIDGYALDDFSDNNTAWVVDPIQVSLPEDTYEENDFLSQAFSLAGFPEGRLSTISGPGRQHDDDWYQLFLQEGDTRLEVTATFDHALGDVDIELYDPDGNFIVRSESVTNQEYIEIGNTPPGFYSLRVYYGNAGNAYDLQWRSYLFLPDDAYEPNNSGPTAYPVDEVDQTFLSSILGVGYQKDDDYYRIRLPEGENAVQVECYFDHALGDIDLELFDSSFRRVGISQGYTGTEAIFAEGVPPGFYYARVYLGNRGNGYNLFMDTYFQPAEDGYEPNNTLAEAYDTESSSIYLSGWGGAGSQSDEDWYRVELPEGRAGFYIAAALRGAGAAPLRGDSSLEFGFYDAEGRLLKSLPMTSTQWVDDVVGPLTPGPYYIRITGPGEGRTYDFIVDLAPLNDLIDADQWSIR